MKILIFFRIERDDVLTWKWGSFFLKIFMNEVTHIILILFFCVFFLTIYIYIYKLKNQTEFANGNPWLSIFIHPLKKKKTHTHTHPYIFSFKTSSFLILRRITSIFFAFLVHIVIYVHLTSRICTEGSIWR